MTRSRSTAAGPVVDGDRELGRKALRLPLPRLRDGRRADEERRTDLLAALAREEERREELDGLAEPHVVRQARAEPASREEAEPADAAYLVRAERAVEALRRLRRRDLLPRVLRIEELSDPALGSH